MSEPLRIKLDRTLCDGFGICARHAPDYFSLDDWGYAVLVGDGNIPEQHRDAVRRALLDCPVHAILEIGERRPDETPIQPLREPDLDQLKKRSDLGVARVVVSMDSESSDVILPQLDRWAELMMKLGT